MTAPWLIVVASFLFATMGVCVKLASAEYASGEIVFYRGLTGAVMMLALTHWRGGSLRTSVASMHFWRCASGVTALSLWFYSIGAGGPPGTSNSPPQRRRERRVAQRNLMSCLDSA